MSSTVTMPFMRPSASTTGTASRSWRLSRRGHRLLVHVLRDGDHVALHDVADRAGRRAAEKRSRKETTPSRCWPVVEHVDVVDRLELAVALQAQVADRLRDRHVGPHAREARVHQAAGVVLGVGQQRRDLARVASSSRPSSPRRASGAAALHQVGGVVGGSRRSQMRRSAVGRSSDQRGLLARGQARGRSSSASARLSDWKRSEALLAVEAGQASASHASMVGCRPIPGLLRIAPAPPTISGMRTSPPRRGAPRRYRLGGRELLGSPTTVLQPAGIVCPSRVALNAPRCTTGAPRGPIDT